MLTSKIRLFAFSVWSVLIVNVALGSTGGVGLDISVVLPYAGGKGA